MFRLASCVSQRYLLPFWLCFCLLFPVLSWAETAESAVKNQPVLSQSIEMLSGKDFRQKRQAVEDIAQSNHAQSSFILTALLNGNLFSDGRLLYVEKTENNQRRYQRVGEYSLLAEKPAGVQKVIINNAIRTWLNGYFAQLKLTQGSKEERLQAIQQLLAKNDSAAVALVKQVMVNEKDPPINQLMQLYVARADLTSADVTRHLAAIEILQKSALAEDVTLLQNYLAHAPSEALQAKAEAAIGDIKTKLSLIDGVQTLSYGLSLGSVLILTAIGLAITFGVMGVINMAHGELMMIGAYTTYVVQQLMPNHLTASLFVALPAAFLVSALIGILIERGVVRHLYGRPLETLLATFGVSLILQQAVRSIFSPLNRLVQTPEFMSGEWVIMPGLSITLNRVSIFIFCLLCFFALWVLMKRSRLGLEVGAVSQNRYMARAMGINDQKVDMLTFGLGSGIAGVAGVALSQLTNVGPNLGQQYIVDSFMVVVTGGVGNLWGTLFSGFGLGILNKFLEPTFGAVLAKALVLVLIIMFIQKYPRGLFPQKGRAVE